MIQPRVHLRLQDFLEGHGRFVAVRHYYRGGTGARFHDHDFAELFWITRGKCRHQLADTEEILVAGDMRFLQPAHAHALQRVGPEPLHLTNLAFPADILERWRRDYPVLRGHYFWSGTSRPSGITLEPSRVVELEDQVHRLAMRTDDLFFLHRFLLDLFHNALPPAPDTRALPPWLKQGLAALGDETVLQGGVSAFARACGRSPEHVARCCREHLGQTPGELVNTARIREAARQLRMTDRDILNIMLDCGHANPSHFYRLFKRQYGLTPRAYRQQRYRVV